MLAAVDLIAIDLAVPVRTPLLTGADIGATADRAGTPDVAKRRATELGLAKMLAIVLGRTLPDSEIGCHYTGCACYRCTGRCDRYVLVLRWSRRLHPFP